MSADRERKIEDALYAKWKGWIEKIYEETVTLFSYRSFYRGLSEITQNNPSIPPSIVLRRSRLLVRDDPVDRGEASDRLRQASRVRRPAPVEHGGEPDSSDPLEAHLDVRQRRPLADEGERDIRQVRRRGRRHDRSGALPG